MINIITKTIEKFYNKNILVLSLDNYYLSKKERLFLSKIHELLITRGVPGTHNIKNLLENVNQFIENKYPINIPLFDKLIDDISKSKKVISRKCDMLFLEGWCCGSSVITKKYLNKNINKLEKFMIKNIYGKLL